MKNDIKNFVWNNIGLTLYSFNSLFFLIIVKLINGADIAGIFTYSFSLCCLFYIIANYYNRAYQVADYSNTYSFNTYFSCRVFTSLLCIIFLIFFLLINKFNVFKVEVILLLMLYRMVESISDCFYGAIQKKDELYKVGISLTIKSLLGLISFLILDILFNNIVYSIIALIIINIVIFVFYDLKNYNLYNDTNLRFTFNKIKTLLIATFPVFIFSFLSMYLANCQKYVMTYYISNELQTIFGILIMPATMLSLIGNYIMMPFINKLVTYYNTKKYDLFKKLALKICITFLLIGFLILICCYYLGIPILNFIYSVDLNAYKIDFIIIIISAIMLALSLIFSSLLTILGENKKQTIIYLISSIIATITSIILIKQYSIIGAVYSYFISFLVNDILYLALYIKKIHDFKRE